MTDFGIPGDRSIGTLPIDYFLGRLWSVHSVYDLRMMYRGRSVYKPPVSKLTGSVCTRILSHEYDSVVVVLFLILPLVACHRYHNACSLHPHTEPCVS